MRVRTFTVPFARIVGEDAKELEFGPEDYCVVRPLFGLSFSDTKRWGERIAEVEKLGEQARDGELTPEQRTAAEAKADSLLLDIMRESIIEWHLGGPDGEPIPMPGTPAALDALPTGLRTRIYPFLSTYRGDDPNPSTRT